MTPWTAQAACAGQGPAAFYADTHDAEAVAAAKATCGRCEVRAECLAFALANGEPDGIWGGLTALERWGKGRVAQRTRPAVCGTRSGYRRHLNHGEEPCEPCLNANAAYQNELDARAGVKGLSSGQSRRRRSVAMCGTSAGYRRHLRLNEPICTACRAAYNEYQRDLRDRHREQAMSFKGLFANKSPVRSWPAMQMAEEAG